MVNNDALALIKGFEGRKLEAYKCPAGRWTIGYGHTGPDVHAGLKITEADATALLTRDLKNAEAYVKANFHTSILNANQYGALVSLVFNVGSLGEGIISRLNKADFKGATATWLQYCNVNGKPSQGLKRRREAEVALFNTPVKP